MRKREVGKYGNTAVIKLKPYDLEDMGWKCGDLVDIEDIVKLKGKKKNEKGK